MLYFPYSCVFVAFVLHFSPFAAFAVCRLCLWRTAPLKLQHVACGAIFSAWGGKCRKLNDGRCSVRGIPGYNLDALCRSQHCTSTGPCCGILSTRGMRARGSTVTGSIWFCCIRRSQSIHPAVQHWDLRVSQRPKHTHTHTHKTRTMFWTVYWYSTASSGRTRSPGPVAACLTPTLTNGWARVRHRE